MSAFKKAARTKQKARIAITGPAKAGKTTLAIATARGLVGPNGRIAVIDTEHGSAVKTCAGYYNFDSTELNNFDPREFIDLITEAEKEGYDAIVIDSLSHEWIGKGGSRELADAETNRSKSHNSFVAWAKVTPLHNALIEAINRSKCHVLATMRVKTEYSLETDPMTGKSSPRKIGLAPIQRDTTEYEFDILLSVDHDHTAFVDGSRYREINGLTFRKPGTEIGEQIGKWLDEGVVAVERPPTPRAEIVRLKELVSEAKMSDQSIRTALSKRSAVTFEQLTRPQAEEMIRNLENYLDEKKTIESFPHIESAKEQASEFEAKRAERDEQVEQGERGEQNNGHVESVDDLALAN